MTINQFNLKEKEQAIWDAAFAGACVREFDFMYQHTSDLERALKSTALNGETAWEVADAAVEAYRKWYQELVDLKDERVLLP